jgi:hypothetical protein
MHIQPKALYEVQIYVAPTTRSQGLDYSLHKYNESGNMLKKN